MEMGVSIMMRRPDFEAIAGVIREYRQAATLDRTVLREFADDLSKYFKQSNPAFDKEKFIRACGYYDG